jgi:hypothetical protein
MQIQKLGCMTRFSDCLVIQFSEETETKLVELDMHFEILIEARAAMNLQIREREP